MVMTVYGQEIPCARAEKGADFVRAYDENGACIFEATKVQSFDGYSIEGGEWSETATPPTNDELAAENKRLKAQMEMQAQNITFLENCLLEMGDIVYA